MDLIALSTVGRLPVDAAASYERMRLHALRDGVDLRPTSAADAHRTRAEQERVFLARYVPRDTGTGDRRVYQGRPYWRLRGVASAAVPGTSNHGLEDPAALDYTGLGGFTGEGYRWLERHGAQYGWVNPEWARRPRAGATPEPWHWEYLRARDGHRGAGGASVARPTAVPIPPTSEEDDMTPEQATQLANLVWAVDQIRGTDLPVIKTQTDRLPAIHAQVDQTRAETINLRNGLLSILSRTATGGGAVDLDDADLRAIATAVADEQARRLTKGA